MAISKRLRHEVMRRDRFTCQYCFAVEAPLTIDHIVPKTLGGSDKPDNLVTACIPCNAGKSSMLPGGSLVEGPNADDLRAARGAKAYGIPAKDRRTVYDGLLDFAAELLDGPEPFWVLFDVHRPEVHTAHSPCVSNHRFFLTVIEASILPADSDWCVSMASDEPEWIDIGDDSFWALPALFCERCVPEPLTHFNRVLPRHLEKL